MKKSNRKQKLLVLVAMVLMIGLVAGMGAMTYSRYISTTQVPAQTATAAKWGYVVTASAENLFSSDYKANTGASATYDGSGNIVVNGDSDALVVAPGTKGSMSIALSGSAEVMAKLTFDLTVTSEIAYDNYNPVKWTLKKDGVAVDDCEGVTLAELKEALDDFNDTNAAIAPGATVTGNYELSWEWAFNVDDATDVKDTLIGYKAAGKAYNDIKSVVNALETTFGEEITEENYNSETYIKTQVKFSLSVTIEQVQG